MPHPHALLAPPFQAAPHGRWRPVLARQVLPPAARDEHIEDALDGSAVVSARPPSVRGRWEKRLDESPLRISDMNPAQAGMLCHLGSVSELPLQSWLV